MTTIHLPPSNYPRTIQKRNHFSVPVSISLAKQDGWNAGKRRSVFRVARFNFQVRQKCISWRRLIVPVEHDSLFPTSKGRRKGAVLAVADLESTLRELVSDPAFLLPVNRGLKKFETPNGAVAQREEVRALVAEVLVGRFAGLPPAFHAASIPRAIQSQRSVDGPVAAVFVRMEAELYASYVVFLAVDITMGRFGVIRRSTRKSPKYMSKHHIARPNEIDMAGLPLGKISFWAPDFLVASEDLRREAHADPLKMTRIGECKCRPHLGRSGYPPAPTLYQLSNAAFRLKRDSLAEALLTESEVMALPQEDGPNTLWFPGKM